MAWFKKLKIRARNNSRSTDNVRTDLGVDRSTYHLAGHVDRFENEMNENFHAVQWHHLLDYTKRYLEPSKTSYLRVWRRIFDSGRSNEWSMVLILVELLFAIPISIAKVERLFSLMNCVKTETKATLGKSSLNNFVTIRVEGPELQDYDPTPAIESWLSTAHR